MKKIKSSLKDATGVYTGFFPIMGFIFAMKTIDKIVEGDKEEKIRRKK